MDNPASGKVMEKCGFRDTGYDFKSLESAMSSRLFYQHQGENLPQVVERLHEDLYLGGIITTSIEDSE